MSRNLQEGIFCMFVWSRIVGRRPGNSGRAATADPAVALVGSRSMSWSFKRTALSLLRLVQGQERFNLYARQPALKHGRKCERLMGAARTWLREGTPVLLEVVRPLEA